MSNSGSGRDPGQRIQGRPPLNRDTFTYREILEQPEAWRRALTSARDQWPAVGNGLAPALTDGNLVVTGCGSSYYLSLAAAAQLRLALGRPVAVLPSSEILIHSPASLGLSRYALLSISRSGETTEVVLATQRARREHQAPVLAVSCYGQSSLAGLGDVALVVESGQETSVVMTKSFTSILLAIQLIAGRLAGGPLDAELECVPDVLSRLLPEYASVSEEAGALPGIEKRIFLGSGPYYGLACEANLKMKEMAIVTSEVYHCLEFRHGPISIVDSTTMVTCFISDAGRAYEVPLLAELKALGATLFVICEKSEPDISAHADYLVELGSGLSEATRAVLYLPFAHLLAYSCAVTRGENPDSPRNLTQVVKLS